MPLHLRVGTVSGFAVSAFCSVYAAILAIGLISLSSPDQAIQNPWFTLMEVLILCIAPAMVGLTVGLYYWTSAERKPLAMLSVLFMSMCVAVTSCVHFAVLVLSRHTTFAGSDWTALVFSFKWPSVMYALDILAWDVFFPLAALFAAFAVHGSGLARLARILLFGSAALAFIGLAGVPLANMSIRNVGIIGYVVLFPIASFLLALIFRRSAVRSAT